VSGWLHNDEDFHVFCNWIEGDRERHLNPDLDSFEELWNTPEKGQKVQVFRVSEAFKKGIIKNAPKNKEEFKTLEEKVTKRLVQEHRLKYILPEKTEKTPTRDNIYEFLREYQIKAIKHWYLSKTFWVNMILMAIATAELMNGLRLLAATHFILIIGMLNILLRTWFTGGLR
ncbi:hypothetical protein ACFL96_07600, partial [Thermoproteota archaeon]